eukprot:5104034-Pleurochrysis_carterae.AAC.1
MGWDVTPSSLDRMLRLLWERCTAPPSQSQPSPHTAEAMQERAQRYTQIHSQMYPGRSAGR